MGGEVARSLSPSNGCPKMTLSPGTRLGPYEILAPIGAGGMGEVYRAKDPRLARELAIKVLPASFSQDPDRLKRFEQEARSAVRPQSSQHHHDPRDRVLGRHALPRDGAHRRHEPARAARFGAASGQEAARRRRPGRRGPRQGARRGDRPPGPEARERHGHERRLREDPRLRPGEALRGAHGQGVRRPDGDPPGDAARHRDGNGRLHVPRAGERTRGRLPVGPVFAGLDPVRDGDFEARVPEEHRRGNADGDHPGRAGARRAGQPEGARPVPMDRRTLPRQGPRRALRLDAGPRAGPEERARAHLGGHDVGLRVQWLSPSRCADARGRFRSSRPRSSLQRRPGFWSAGARRRRRSPRSSA